MLGAHSPKPLRTGWVPTTSTIRNHAVLPGEAARTLECSRISSVQLLAKTCEYSGPAALESRVCKVHGKHQIARTAVRYSRMHKHAQPLSFGDDIIAGPCPCTVCLAGRHWSRRCCWLQAGCSTPMGHRSCASPSALMRIRPRRLLRFLPPSFPSGLPRGVLSLSRGEKGGVGAEQGATACCKR